MQNKIRIKKALVEAKFMAKPEDMDKLMPKLGKDDVVKLVDEADITEAPAVNNPKIEKYVAELNALIARAVDGDGDPVGVVDTKGTWEEGYIYAPIIYQNGALKISSKNAVATNFDTEVIRKSNMEFDGIPTLQRIRRMYTALVKKLSATTPQMEGDENETAGRAIAYGVKEPELSDDEREEMNRPIHEDDVNPDKLRVDVAKLMEKLNLGQFENVFKKIDKPQEQAEVIAAFAERIGVPRAKLGAVLASMRDIAESKVAPIITKDKLEEFVNKQKTL